MRDIDDGRMESTPAVTQDAEVGVVVVEVTIDRSCPVCLRADGFSVRVDFEGVEAEE